MLKPLSTLILLGAALAASAAPTVESRFDTDLDGWTAAGDGLISYDAVNGWAHDTDLGLGTAFGFRAPAKFLGDKSAYFGGTLSWRVNPSVNNGAFGALADLTLSDGVTILSVNLPDPTAGVFNDRSVVLDATTAFYVGAIPGGVLATQAQIQTVLSGLTVMEMQGEYSNGVDVADFDDAVLKGAVPEPMPMAVLGLGTLALLRRRKA